MIEFEPTKYAAGAYIWGDYRDLRALHSSIHDIIEAAPYGEHITNLVLSLAYDIRHCYQGKREQKEFGIDDFEKVVYSGTHVLWHTS